MLVYEISGIFYPTHLFFGASVVAAPSADAAGVADTAAVAAAVADGSTAFSLFELHPANKAPNNDIITIMPFSFLNVFKMIETSLVIVIADLYLNALAPLPARLAA